jgi:dolichol-phosphate mannosyltransferase
MPMDRKMEFVQTASADVASQLAALSAHSPPAPGAGLALAVIVPTYNERANVAELAARLERVLAGVRFEIIFVDDDSPDGTAEEVRRLAMARPWIRGIRRVGRRGLASACMEGMLSTAAPVLAVMDADLQHDETILRRMFELQRSGGYDVVVGTRNAAGGSMGEFAPWRVQLSNWGLGVSRLVTRSEVSDPMSGFFVLDRRFLDEVVYRASGVGFKILVDLLASAKRPVRVGEVPYSFRQREQGESKLDLNVGLDYLYLLADKLAGQWIPVRFVLYSGVGAVGVLMHLGVLRGALNAGMPFGQAQTLATGLAMTGNFLLNNLVTYRDLRLKGWRLLPGLLTFYLACSVGFFTNLSVSETLVEKGLPWVWAGLAGLAISSMWNYGVTNVITWRRRLGVIRKRESSS